MAAAFRSLASLAYGTRANSQVPYPAGIQAGDVLWVMISRGADGTPPALSTPSGWTAITGNPFTLEPGDVSYHVHTNFYWKVATGTESGTLNFTHASIDCNALMVAYSGVAHEAPTYTDNEGTGTTTTALSITPTVDGTLIAFFAENWIGYGAASPPTGTNPSFTERYDGDFAYLATGVQATAGATGNKSHSNNNVGGNPWRGMLWAFKPKPQLDAALVGTRTSSATGSNTIVTGSGTSVEENSTLLVAISYDNERECTAVTDNKGNTYSKILSQLSNGFAQVDLWVCEDAVGGSGHQATATFDGTDLWGTVYLVQITAPGGAIPRLDKSAGAADDSSPYTVTTPTLSTDDQIAITIAGYAGFGTANHTSSNSTTIDRENDDTYYSSIVTKALLTSTSAFTPSFTNGLSSPNGALAVATFMYGEEQEPLTLPVEHATVSITGQEVKAILAVPFDEALVSITGQEVGLVATFNKRLAVDHATVAITGQDVGLVATSHRTMTVEPATVSITGQDVALIASGNRVLAVDHATVSIQGQDVGLVLGDPPAPAPAPAPHPPLDGAPTGHRVAVRIDGRLYIGSYREISAIIEARARQDAERSPEPTKTRARKAARKMVGDLRSVVEIEEPIPVPGIDPALVATQMFRDLRALYSDMLVNAMLESNRIRNQQDEEAAMRAAEALLMGD